MSRVKELQNVEEKMKQVLKDAPHAFNDPESFQKANTLEVETYKGADSHADLRARMEALFEGDAGDATRRGRLPDWRPGSSGVKSSSLCPRWSPASVPSTGGRGS